MTSRCAQGHEWTNGAAACPSCGGAALPTGTVPGPAGAETLHYTPKAKPAPDPNAATLGPDEPAMVLPVDRPRIQDYEIIDELGRGGMGVVYKAEQLKLKRPVALKMILAGSHAGKDHKSRFQNEAEAVARLQHPNIVHIYEIGEHEGKPFLALEYVDGGTLAQRLAAAGARPSTNYHETARLVECLARAVHHAHQRHIIHRDLKPGNVLLMADGTPKITDFGLAKQLQGDTPATGHGAATVTGAIMGTPSYMAPEQADGKKNVLGPATDIYALGAMLYELLTGEPPFKGDSPMSIAIKVVTEEPRPPRRLQARVPGDLETICLKCLEKDPTKRYPTAEALADDLRRFQQGDPIAARRVGIAGRTGRWLVRRWKPAALVASGVFLTFGVFVCLGILDNLGMLDSAAENGKNEALARTDESDQDLRRFQGNWKVTGVIEDGSEAPPDLLTSARATFAGDRFSFQMPNRSDDLLVRLNASKTPREVDFFAAFVKDGNPQLLNGVGIYQWKTADQDTLEVCFHPDGKTRPTDFTAKAGSHRVMITMKRIKEPSVAQGDLERLQGTWIAETLEADGFKAPPQVTAACRITFDGNRFIQVRPQVKMEGFVLLSPNKHPKEMDGIHEGDASKQRPGIYEFDGDRLRCCFGAPGGARPTDFTADKGSGRALAVYRRARPEEVVSQVPAPEPAALPPDLNLIPRDAPGFVSFRPADLMASEALKRLQAAFAKQKLAIGDQLVNAWPTLIKDALTIPLEQLERATFVMLDEDGDDVVVILATKQPYDRKRLLERQDAKVLQLQQDNPRYFLITGKDYRYSVYLVSDTVLIVGLSGKGAASPPGPPPPGQPPAKRPLPQERGKSYVSQVHTDGRIVFSNTNPRAEKGQLVIVHREDKSQKPEPAGRRLGFLEIVEVQKDTIVARPVPGQTIRERIQPNDHVVFTGRTVTERHTSIEDLIWQLPTITNSGPLQASLQQAAGKHQITLGVNLTIPKFKQLGESLPPQFKVAEPLTHAGAVTLTADFHPLGLRPEVNLELELRFHFANEALAAKGFEAAQATQAMLRDTLPGLARMLNSVLAEQKSEWGNLTAPLAYFVDEFGTALQSTRVVSRSGLDVQASLLIRLDFEHFAASFGRATEKVRDAAERIQSQNNLKQIALAFERYERAHGFYPPAFSRAADGQPLLSWRVLILPHFQEPSLTELYQRFRLDEPWNSTHNDPLLLQMPGVYTNPRLPSGKGPTGTHYQRLLGEGTASEPSLVKGLRRQDIIDGLANTISVIEVEKPLPWTKPDDADYSPRKPLPDFGGIVQRGFNAVFLDGSVRFFPAGFDEKTLRALITRAGMEPVDVGKLP
jgi:uncharacterized protein (TIGR03067 family)